MARHVHFAGLVIAGLGFFLTRFTVTLAINQEPARFYLAGVVPLALGLGLAAFGVALAVADVEASLVRTTALWCVAGAGAMAILVALTILGSMTGSMPAIETIRSRTYLANFLIGGSVGGTLTGLYAARNRRQRGELRQQTYRLAVLNRLLRHEILNAVTVIRGYATIGGDDGSRARTVIEEHSDAIEETIEEVKYLTRTAWTSETADDATDVGSCLADSAELVRNRHPDANIVLDSHPHPEELAVRADERLEQVFVHLLENAVVHTADDAIVEVSVSATANDVRVSVNDEGPGLPEDQQALLERGEIGEFDDPGSGFGLNVVRLLVESYGGSIETDISNDGTTISVILRRAATQRTGLRPTQSGLVGVRPAIPQLVVTLGAALLAGVVFGIVAEQLGGSVGVIGVYYGIEHPVVGWLTHEFHSVVFGFVFAGLVSLAPARYRTRASVHVAIGAGWGIVLWLLAAGVVSPIWLQLLGIPASIPNLSLFTFATHLAWGISLGAFTSWGYAHVTPRLTRLGGRLGRSPVRA